MSDWVPEAQRIAKEAAEKAREAVMEHVNVAMGLLIQNAPSAAQALLEALVLETDIPRQEHLRALSLGDWARASERGNAIALNDRLAEARDAALEEVAKTFDADAEEVEATYQRQKQEPGGEDNFDLWNWYSAKSGEAKANAQRLRALKGRK